MWRHRGRARCEGLWFRGGGEDIHKPRTRGELLRVFLRCGNSSVVSVAGIVTSGCYARETRRAIMKKQTALACSQI